MMEKIRNEARLWTYRTLTIAATVYIVLFASLPFAHDFLTTVKQLGVSWTAIAFAILYVYHRHLWKFTNRRLYLAGVWDFTEEQFAVLPGASKPKHKFNARGSMTIVQSVQSISFTDGRTYLRSKKNPDEWEDEPNSEWWSIACELYEKPDDMVAAIDHRAKGDEDTRGSKYGAEVFKIGLRGKRGIPVTMTSTVYHSWRGGIPHQVHVSYKRRAILSRSRRGTGQIQRKTKEYENFWTLTFWTGVFKRFKPETPRNRCTL